MLLDLRGMIEESRQRGLWGLKYGREIGSRE
jgi:hypothetical protein